MPKATIWLIEKHSFTIFQETQLFEVNLNWGNSYGEIWSWVVLSLISTVKSTSEISYPPPPG